MITAEIFVEDGTADAEYVEASEGAVLVREHGIDRIRVTASAEDVVARTVDVVRGSGARVLRVSPWVVSVPELAALTGEDRDEVRKWTRRKGFPAVFGNLRSHKMWLLEELVDWFADEGISLKVTPPTAEMRRELSTRLGESVGGAGEE